MPAVSSRIRSPVRTRASGPPMADSGAICRTTVPKPVPLMRASLMRTMSVTPARSSRVGMGRWPDSGMPGAPTGPPFCRTSTSSGSISSAGSSMVSCSSATLRNTTARPSCWSSDSVAAETFRTAPSGHRLPRRMARLPPLAERSARGAGSTSLVDDRRAVDRLAQRLAGHGPRVEVEQVRAWARTAGRPPA